MIVASGMAAPALRWPPACSIKEGGGGDTYINLGPRLGPAFLFGV